MKDIHGPDAASWWPPALGWWLLAALLLVIIGVAVAAWWWQRKRANDWRVDADARMRALSRSMRDNDIKASTSELSELLRRVAMARYGRQTCASLTGDDWLQWLTENDPVGFDWSKHGRVLIDLPYLPAGAGAGNQDLRKLAGAAKRWVSTAPADSQDVRSQAGLKVRVSVEQG